MTTMAIPCLCSCNCPDPVQDTDTGHWTPPLCQEQVGIFIRDFRSAADGPGGLLACRYPAPRITRLRLDNFQWRGGTFECPPDGSPRDYLFTERDICTAFNVKVFNCAVTVCLRIYGAINRGGTCVSVRFDQTNWYRIRFNVPATDCNEMTPPGEITYSESFTRISLTERITPTIEQVGPAALPCSGEGTWNYPDCRGGTFIRSGSWEDIPDIAGEPLRTVRRAPASGEAYFDCVAEGSRIPDGSWEYDPPIEGFTA